MFQGLQSICQVDVHFFFSRGIILWIELPWPKNLANPYARYTETLDSCFDLIWLHQQCIPWSPTLEIESATTDCRVETLQLSSSIEVVWYYFPREGYVTTPCRPNPTMSASLSQTTHGQWFVQWFPIRGLTHYFTDTQSTTEGGRKEQTRAWVSSKRKKESLRRFRAVLHAFVDYCGRLFCVKLLQKPLTMLTSSRVG